MSNHETTFTPHPIPDGLIEANGGQYMLDGTGNLRAVENIKPADKLRDEMIRREFGFVLALHHQVARFKGHLMTNLGSFDAMMAQEYDVKIGGRKGTAAIPVSTGCGGSSCGCMITSPMAPRCRLRRRCLTSA